MSIVSSEIIEDSPQVDGRRAIRERHTDHLGGIFDVAYIAGENDNAAATMAARVSAGTVSDKSGYSISGTTTTLDALQTALNSAHGAGSWATATGFSTHSAADVWAVATRVLTAGTNIVLPSNGLSSVTAWTVAITGDITGNLSGSVGSVTGLTTATIADAVWDEAISDHATAGSTGATLSAASAPSAATVADAVWDELLSGHAISGSAGAGLTAAGSAGDPWSTVLASYAAGTAGYAQNLIADINSNVLSYTTAAVLNRVGPVLTGGNAVIIQGDSYSADFGRQLAWAESSWPALPADAVITMRLYLNTTEKLSVTGEVTGTRSVLVELTAEQTAALDAGTYDMQVFATIDDDVITLVGPAANARATCQVLARTSS